MRRLLDLTSVINVALDSPKIFLCFVQEAKRGIIPSSCIPLLHREGKRRQS